MIASVETKSISSNRIDYYAIPLLWHPVISAQDKSVPTKARRQLSAAKYSRQMRAGNYFVS